MDLPDHQAYDHTQLTKPTNRPLTPRETEWINSILLANTNWADATVGELLANGECTCGCQTIHIGHSPEPQNPKVRHLDWEHVGEIWIYTEEGKCINVGLFAKNGTLCELEVVCEQGTEPVPTSWRERSRKVW